MQQLPPDNLKKDLSKYLIKLKIFSLISGV